MNPLTAAKPATPAINGRPSDRDPSWEALVADMSRRIAWESVLPPDAGSGWWQFRLGLKRALDIAGSLAALILLSPIMAVVALLVSLDGGPVFYRWRVVGHRGRPFTGYKFRTMVRNADDLKDELQHLNEMSGPVFKIRNDPRITPIGRFLRRHSIDEMPQFWSVLKGDMSLVGPRPPSAREFVEFRPEQRLKLAAQPGLTCIWQVSGRTNIVDFDEWVRLDLEYIRGWSLRGDFALLWRTVLVVLKGSGGY